MTAFVPPTANQNSCVYAIRLLTNHKRINIMQTKNTNINQKNTQKLKCFLYFYIVFIMISGIAVAEHNVIVVFHNKYVDLSEDQVISSHGGFVKKNFHLIPAVSARVPDNKIQEMKNDSRIAYVEDD